MAKKHLITGATGFVGAALVLELLQRSDAVIYCLVRPRSDGEDIQTRLLDSLSNAAHAYGLHSLSADIAQRCIALRGDILQVGCAISGTALKIDEIWHAAASLKFENKHRQEIDAHNIDGTRHMLELARTCNAPIFNYISTAYVAGSRCGLIREQLAAADTPVNNCYEASKVVAERLVADAGLYHRILRPSIVIGHSRTLAATSFTGFYGFIRQLLEFNQQLALRGYDLFARPLHIRAEPDTPMNLIPVDWVAQDAVSISLADAMMNKPRGCAYHLTNPHAPNLETDMRLLYKHLGLPLPVYTDSQQALNPADLLLDSRLQFYTSYLCNRKTFSRQNTDVITGTQVFRRRFGEREVAQHINWYLNVLAKSGLQFQTGQAVALRMAS